jgi:Domain of unknown function (DUF4377)
VIQRVVVLIALLALVSCNQPRVSEKLLYVAPTLSSATSTQLVKPQLSPIPPCETNCLQVKDDLNAPWYNLRLKEIEGFTFESGFRYKLRVRLTETATDGIYLGRSYQLLETLEKTPISN